MISENTVERLKYEFIGQYVVIYLKDMNIATVNSNGGDLAITAMVEGYVIDVDRDFFYMGIEKDQFMKTVSHDVAGITEIHTGEIIMKMMLEEDIDGDMH